MSTKLKAFTLFFYKGKVNKVVAKDIEQILDDILVILEDYDDKYYDATEALKRIIESVRFIGYN